MYASFAKVTDIVLTSRDDNAFVPGPLWTCVQKHGTLKRSKDMKPT